MTNKVKKFGNDFYRLERSVLTKESANYFANQQRKKGRLARMVKATKKEQSLDGSRWHIYIR